MNGDVAAAAAEEQHGQRRWKTLALLALAAGIAASRFRKRHIQAGGQSRWFAPSEADLWQERMDEIDRKERVRRVQGAFHRRQSSFTNLKNARYQKWEEHPQQKAKDGVEADVAGAKEKARLKRHYLVLGLDPLKEVPFTEDEIKAAFRERALQYHPDQNPDNLDATREKFRELVDSYQAIKQEKNIK